MLCKADCGIVELAVTTCGFMSESAESTWQLAPTSDRVCQHKQIEDLVLDAHVPGGGKRLPLRIITRLLAAPLPHWYNLGQDPFGTENRA